MKKVITKEDVDAIFAPEGEMVPVLEQSVQSLYLDAQGRELPNSIPVEPPVGYIKRKTIAEQMREMIRYASEEAKMAGAETEAEANDFDIDDEFDPSTPYEHDFEPDPVLDHMIALASRPPKPAASAASPAEPAKTAVTPPQ